METKTFSVVTSISMVLALTAAVLSIIGIAITGLYPGIIVLLLVALIPIASKFYAKKIISKSNDFRRNYYTTLTIINLLLILVVLWMTFVIVHDRVLHQRVQGQPEMVGVAHHGGRLDRIQPPPTGGRRPPLQHVGEQAAHVDR